MFGMIGLGPDYNVDEDKEEETPAPVDTIVPGDIIVVATREKRPVFLTSVNYDDHAELRVLGIAQGDRKLYLCLVTPGDAEHVTPTTVVGRSSAFDYGVEERFSGCDAIVVTDLHVKRVAKQQRGRFCQKCSEYNEDVRTPSTETYMCRTCRENPWR